MRHKTLALVPLLIFGLMLATALPALADQAATQPKVVAICADNIYNTGFALLDNGTVWAWGFNDFGQLGDGTTVTKASPVMVPIDHVVSVSISGGHALALKDDGTVREWGCVLRRDYPGGCEFVLHPRQVSGLADIKYVAGGLHQNYALDNTGTLWTWGRNCTIGTEAGSSRSDVYSPVRVNLSGVRKIASGTGSEGPAFAFLKADGTVWAPGSDRISQLPLKDIVDIACARNGVVALKDDGTVWGVGDSDMFYNYGDVPNSAGDTGPFRAEGLSGIRSVSAGSSYYALKDDGTVLAWGMNVMGSLGIGEYCFTQAPGPIPVSGLDRVKSISAGDAFCLALKDDGTVWAWGRTVNGELGVGVTTVKSSDGRVWGSIPVPVQVPIGYPGPAVLPDPDRFLPVVVPPVQVNATSIDMASAPAVNASWLSSTGDSIRKIAYDDVGSIYAFSEDKVYRFSGDGKKLWSLDIPSQWRALTTYERVLSVTTRDWTGAKMPAEPIFDFKDGYLYIYVTPASPLPGHSNQYGHVDNQGNQIIVDPDTLSWALLAISPDGNIAWTRPLPTDTAVVDVTAVRAVGDRIYVFHNYNETVLDRNGNVIFNVPNVSDPAAIDESGNLYLVQAVAVEWSINYMPGEGRYADFRMPTAVMAAYDRDGKLLWQKDTGIAPVRQFVAEAVRPVYGTLPICQHGTLYVPVKDGIVAMGTDGNILWSAHMNGYYRLLDVMPMDAEDNVYLTYLPINRDYHNTEIYVIGDDGRSIIGPRSYSDTYGWLFETAGKDGIIYNVALPGNDYFEPNDRPLDDLREPVVYAYDVRNDSILWSYRLTLKNKLATVINETNVADVIGFFDPAEDVSWNLREQRGMPYQVLGGYTVDIVPADDIVYVSVRSMNHESPIAPGESRAVFASGIYAIDRSGKTVVMAQSGSVINAIAANNSSVFFATGDGRIGMAAMAFGLVAGLALLGAIAIAAKLFLFGTVARARSRVDKNDNRNQAMAYIRAHPGLTLYEISRGMQMNMGTARYHLFILGMNHKIATFNDGKFVRYFPNSNFYSKEEQLIIALMRREVVRKMIEALLGVQGMTNVELSQRLGQPDSAVSKLLKELCAKGIMVKTAGQGERPVYSLESRYHDTIIRLSQRLNNE